jgi:uncharacterized membrane protein (UPF0127 family)
VVTTDSGVHRFQVEIADDPAERARGLMFRREMADDAGMLFDFKVEERASFWMKNTYIPLDMLFIRADGTIDSIAERTTPLSEKSVPSKGPVRYVLEINGGLSERLASSLATACRERRWTPTKSPASVRQPAASSFTGLGTVSVALWSIAFGAESSSAIPFLKLLMPCARSPIIPEILPLPNRRTMIPPMIAIFQILRPNTCSSRNVRLALPLHCARRQFRPPASRAS